MLFITIFLFISTINSPTVYSVPPITQNTLIVDITGNGDFTSIKDAINNANPTDIIRIRRGTYYEHNIVINKKIQIIGESPSNTIIDCSGNLGFTINSPYVDISDLKIINTEEYGILILQGSIGCIITNCIIDANDKSIAIDVRSSYNTISDCNLKGESYQYQGVKIYGSYNVVKNCEIQEFSNGILLLINSNNNQIQNCNIINTEVAIDIRINSKNNVVTGCTLLSNLQGMRIWQNSNYNQVYLNNFLRNNIDATDENNNSWDNGEQGNYWDKYRGIDADRDGIGDTPYIISVENVDNYPLMSMIEPDIVNPPLNVRITTSQSIKTPSFTWAPSFYINGIKGYYVIDDNEEIFIGNLTNWTSTKTLVDGVHTFSVRAISNDNKTSTYSTISFTIDTAIIDSDRDGYSDEIEVYWGTNPNDPNSYPLDTDGDGLPDIIEIRLGSNPKNPNDVTIIYIKAEPYYLIDVTQNRVYDLLYEHTDKAKTGVEKRDDKYLLDINGNGQWDYSYNILDKSIVSYSEPPSAPTTYWILLIAAVILTILVVIFWYTRKRQTKVLGVKKIEREEKPYTLLPLETKDTTVMIRQTKTLLQQISKDVNVYMDQLQQLEEQFIMPFKDQETEITSEEIIKKQDIQTIEAKIDKLLLDRENEDEE